MEQSAYEAREALEKAFKEYHSINNLSSRKKVAHYPEDMQNKKWVSRVNLLCIKNVFSDWNFGLIIFKIQLVLEKVHGANLSFIYDGEFYQFKKN